MIDSDGYRLNVGIILSNREGKLFWARRVGQDAWQFPQGGIDRAESPEEAMYRELTEETGLSANDVEILGCTSDWLKYRLPKRYVRRNQQPVCVGQKQIWFMLRMLSKESAVNLSSSDKPEFDNWCWVDYWEPSRKVIFFKRKVYKLALTELEPLLTESAG
ncbi:MAG: RNA pyrophosphohydrolase [Gammaproteobacteria bacterium]|nr:RNA pyrophosphohydrolase [Gammaproteobacteria bacterium]